MVPGGCFLQAAAPSQVPSVPQVDTAVATHSARGSTTPSPVGAHMPGVVPAEQLRQAPWQDSLQQTPSVQNPLPQSRAVAQGCPIPFFPQLPRASQIAGAVQSSLTAQVAVQAPFRHRKGSQGTSSL